MNTSEDQITKSSGSDKAKASTKSNSQTKSTPKPKAATKSKAADEKQGKAVSEFGHLMSAFRGKIDQFLIQNSSKFVTNEDIMQATGCREYKAKRHVRHLVKFHGATVEHSKQDDQKFKLVFK